VAVAREEELESRWEAAPAVLAIVAMQTGLGFLSFEKGWDLWVFPWWIWLVGVVPEALLFGVLAFTRPREHLEQLGKRRMAGLTLLGLISATNALFLVALMGSIIDGSDETGGQLLLNAAAVWTTNVLAFGLWYWDLDRGGPVRRRKPKPPAPDFRFTQMETPEVAEDDWEPHLVDYLYVSFTNSIAFSPTDTMPLTRRAKLMMMAESSISAITILLVAARSISLLG
jgi:hypothetical protein